ncbi:hypothetical protein ACA910_022733 [Epithemia clementina (nom. ined.)]
MIQPPEGSPTRRRLVPLSSSWKNVSLIVLASALALFVSLNVLTLLGFQSDNDEMSLSSSSSLVLVNMNHLLFLSSPPQHQPPSPTNGLIPGHRNSSHPPPPQQQQQQQQSYINLQQQQQRQQQQRQEQQQHPSPPQQPPTPRTTIIREFERQDGVVIVTKLHGPNDVAELEQSLCLLHYAYNHRVLYDIVVFSTLVVNDHWLYRLRQLVAPAQVTVVWDNRGLHEEIAALSPQRRRKFLERCQQSTNTTLERLTWHSYCTNQTWQPTRLSYNWQAEFRAWHIWTHPALSSYRTMLWIDTDSFCTKVWHRDPVAFFRQHNLTILFDHVIINHAVGPEVQRRIVKAFNTTLCDVALGNGQLQSEVGGPCPHPHIPVIHGFFHVTNLDFYRTPLVQTFLHHWIGDCFLCREYDDQDAVTIPVAILAPHQAWDLRFHGLNLSIFHNYVMDGRPDEPLGGFRMYWNNTIVAHNTFPEAYGKCPITRPG